MLRYLILLLLLCLLPPGLQARNASNKLHRIRFVLSADSISIGQNYYVSVEGISANGKFMAVDPRIMVITCSHGTMNWNKWIPPTAINFEKVRFHVYIRDKRKIAADTIVWLKRVRREGKMPGEMDLPVVPKHIPGRQR